MDRLSHIDEQGRARMVDISKKPDTLRVARARARVLMKPQTLKLILENKAEKGDVLQVARIAGIMAAKKTSDLIPLCHPLRLTSVAVDFEIDQEASAVEILTTAKTLGQTGVEMEALTAASVAALTVYDMCKAVDREMTITEIMLLEKSGGKSGTFRRT